MTKLASFLDAGKPIYIEGNDFGYFNGGSPFYSMFGGTFVKDGNPLGNISELTGQAGTITDGLDLDYSYGVPILDEYEDVIAADTGDLIFKSQQGYGRAVAYDAGSYRSIYGSFVFGGIIDGTGLNVKSELMRRYLDFFFNAVPDIDLELAPEAAEVPRGGELVIDISLANNTSGAITFTVDADVYLPNGNPYPGNPVAGPVTLTLGAGASLTHRYSHAVPGNAPLGEYTYTGTVTGLGGQALDSDTFTFTITAY